VIGLPSSIRVKLTLFVAVVVTITAATTAVVGYRFAHQTLRDEINLRLSQKAADLRKLVLAYIARQKGNVALVASRTRLRQLLDERANGTVSPEQFQSETRKILLDAIVASRLENLPAEFRGGDFLAILIADESGRVVAATDEGALGQGISFNEDFLAGKRTAHLGVPFRKGDDYRAYVSCPAVTDGGRRFVVLVLLDVTLLAAILEDKRGLCETEEVYVGTRSAGGDVQLLLPTRLDPLTTEGSPQRFAILSRAIGGEEGLIQTRDYRNVEVLAAYAPLGYRDWGMVAKIDVAVAYRPLAMLRTALFGLEGCILLAGVAASYLLARRFSQPILALSEQAAAVAAGDLNARVKVTGADELGTLAAAFNHMIAELASAYATLEQRVRQRTSEMEQSNRQLHDSEDRLREQAEILQSVLDSIADGVVVADQHGKFVLWNPAAEHIIGIGTSDTGPQQWSERYGLFLPDTVTPLPADQVPLVRALRGECLANEEVFIRNPSRPEGVWVSVNGTPLRDRDGKASGGVVVFRDITERKRAAVALEQHAAELQRSNHELEQFAYVASHDLQEPLRTVAAYCQLVQRRYDDKLDREGKEFLAYAVESAARMKGLIDGLLDYSRVQTQGRPFVETAGDAALDHALANLSAAIAESGAKLTRDPLPTVSADARQLVHLFQNLVSNAIKYRGDATPEIHIGCQRKNDHWEFSVRDNGIGIAGEHAEKIFVIFQRLHTREEYPGTGIGLAICKRIVERHNGQLWVASEPGIGSTFYFTLPAHNHHHVPPAATAASKMVQDA
jgi:PAS domain S-box-containing protein